MEIARGQVVQSRAGHDKGHFFTVLDYASPFALLCDGKRRRLAKPKKKKVIHLAVTKMCLPEDALQSDRAVRAALSTFRRQD